MRPRTNVPIGPIWHNLYYHHMTKPKPHDPDPFLAALATAPRAKLLSRQQAAMFLDVGLTTLDGWRSRSLPPPWTDLRGMIRYQVGDLIDFVQSLPRTAVAGNEIAAAPDIPTGNLQQTGMYSPIMRGGRRKKQVTSFASWLADGDPASPWRFAMVDDLGTQYPRRPVDLIATLDFDLADDVPCGAMTMLKYARAMAEYAQAAEQVVERDRLDRELPPSQGGPRGHGPNL